MAVNVKGKKTTLGEEASIYAKRDESKGEKERWGEMTKEERRVHFKEYYLRTTLLLAIAVTFLGYMAIHAVLTHRDQELFVAIVNDSMEPEVMDEFTDELMGVLGLNPKREKVTIDTDFVLTGTPADAAMRQRLTAYVYSKTLDVIIADQETFQEYRKNGAFLELDELLPKEVFERYGEYVLSEAGRAYGLKLKGSRVYQDLGMHQPAPIVGIVANTKRTDRALAFLNHLFPTK